MSSFRKSRREFLRISGASAIAAAVTPSAYASTVHELPYDPPRPVGPNDTIRLATIGMGIIGFINTEAALELPGVEFVAAADAYDSRLKRTKEVFGDEVFTTRDYREILARSDVDAVIVATPDHWHAQMAIDAMETGKAVYLEKPMVHSLEEGPTVIEKQEETGAVLIVGSQHSSDILYEQARKLYEDGAIGKLNMIEANFNRNSALGAWKYSLPVDASPETIDWDRFLGNAPQREFDPVRFFRWRNYWDYGTGVAGDLYVHLFTAIHYVLSAKGPTQAQAQGILSYWDDGRDVPDVMIGLYNYPEADAHPSFLLSLQTNFVDGGGGGSSFRFIGNEGVMSVSGGTLTLSRQPMQEATAEQLIEGYNSVRTFAEADRDAFARELAQRQQEERQPAALSQSQEYRAPQGYSSRLDHFANFFEAIRNGAPVLQDVVFGYRAAAPSLLANLSYRDQQIYSWDPDLMQLQA